MERVPTETRTPNLHRAKIAPRECGWKDGDSGNSGREEDHVKQKTTRTYLTPIGLLMEGDSASLRISFAKNRVNECYRDVSTEQSSAVIPVTMKSVLEHAYGV